MYVNVQSIQDNSQDSKEVAQKSCAHEIIHLNNVHGTKHAIKLTFYQAHRHSQLEITLRRKPNVLH